MIDYKLIGYRIKEARKQNALTQEALAEKINITDKSLSLIERGTNFVSAETLNNICMAMSVSPKVLFDFNTETPDLDYLNEINNRFQLAFYRLSIE